MNLQIKNICILQLLVFLNSMYALTTAPEVSVIKGNGSTGSISRYYVHRQSNSTDLNNLMPLGGIDDISKLLRELKIKESLNQAPGTKKNGTDRYKVYIRRKLTTFKHPRKLKKDRKENSTRIFVQSNQHHIKYLPASEKSVHYKKISIGKPIRVYSKATMISPYAVRSENHYESNNKQEANFGRSGENGETSTTALEDVKERFHDDESQETRLPNKGKTLMETEVPDGYPEVTEEHIDGELEGDEEDVNINENINGHSQKLEEEAETDLPNIETYSSSQRPESSHGQNNILHGQSVLSENSESLAHGSPDSRDYIQLDTANTPGTQTLFPHTSYIQTSFDSYPSGEFSYTTKNKLKGSHENGWTDFYESNHEEPLVRNIHYKERFSSGLEKAFDDDDEDEEAYLPKKQQLINNIHNYIDNMNVQTHLPVYNINEGQRNSPFDLTIQEQNNSLQPNLINKEEVFVPIDQLDQEKTDIPVSINEELKPALTTDIDENPYDSINHENLQEQQHADSDGNRNEKMELTNLPTDQSDQENISSSNENIGHKQTNAFLNQNGAQVFSSNIPQGPPYSISGLIHNGEIKWTSSSSAKLFKENVDTLSDNIHPESEVFVTHSGHPEVFVTNINEAPSGNIAHEESSYNFINQGVGEVPNADNDQEQPHIISDPFDNWDTEWTDLSSTENIKDNTRSHNENINPKQTLVLPAHIKGEHKCGTCGNIPHEQSSHDSLNDFYTELMNLSPTQAFKDNTHAHNENINPEQTQVPPAYIKGEHKCGICGNILQEQSPYDLINQEVVEVPSSDIHQEQLYTVSDPVNTENTEWSDISSNKIFKGQTHFPPSHIYHEQVHIFPIHINQETDILPDTHNTEDTHTFKVKDYEMNTLLKSQEEALPNKHLFALNNLRELVVRLQVRLRIDDSIQLSSFYKMIKLIFLVLKSQMIEDNSEYSIWLRQLNPVIRYRLIKYVNNLIRRRWVQNLMVNLYYNHYNLDIPKLREWSTYLISWYNELDDDIQRFLDKPLTEEDIHINNLEPFTINRPYLQHHRLYHFVRPVPPNFSKIFRKVKTHF